MSLQKAKSLPGGRMSLQKAKSQLTLIAQCVLN